MEDLVARLSAIAGIDAATAEKAIGIILAFLEKEGPADAVAKNAEDEPAARPPDHENHRGVAGVLRNRAVAHGRCSRHGTKQFRNRGAACQREQLLVHRVEQPPKRSRQKDEPMFGRQFTVPSA